MPYGVVLKDERPTSNIERPTSNNDVAPLLKLFQHRMKKQTPNEKQRFMVQMFRSSAQNSKLATSKSLRLLTSVSSSFPIKRSMLDVRCSMFIFFQPILYYPVHPVKIMENNCTQCCKILHIMLQRVTLFTLSCEIRFHIHKP